MHEMGHCRHQSLAIVHKSALESVLECDEERATLLKREKQLLAGSDESSADLAQIYARLQAVSYTHLTLPTKA